MQFANVRTDIDALLTESGLLEYAKLNHTPWIVFLPDGMVRVELDTKELLRLSDTTEVMVQWRGEWRSDFFHLTVGDVRIAVKNRLERAEYTLGKNASDIRLDLLSPPARPPTAEQADRTPKEPWPVRFRRDAHKISKTDNPGPFADLSSAQIDALSDAEIEHMVLVARWSKEPSEGLTEARKPHKTPKFWLKRPPTHCSYFLPPLAAQLHDLVDQDWGSVNWSPVVKLTITLKGYDTDLDKEEFLPTEETRSCTSKEEAHRAITELVGNRLLKISDSVEITYHGSRAKPRTAA